jgi:hypothetical protein
MKILCSEMTSQARRMPPVVPPLPLLAVALPLRPASDIFTAKLDCSEPSLDRWAEQDGWKPVRFTIELHFPRKHPSNNPISGLSLSQPVDL